MNHAWCRDIARDAAVRAAEDGRTGPLPTLAEAIARPFTEAAKCSAPVSETGERQSGMRTERVVLEITHNLDDAGPASGWEWKDICQDWIGSPVESVRVVGDEERQNEMSNMEDTLKGQRDAAISERESLREQLESVACRAATAETALAEIKSLDYTRAAVNGAAWQANKIAAKALEAASGGGEGEPVALSISPAERDGLQVIVDGVIRHGNGFVVIPGSDSLRAVESLLARHTTAPPQPRGWLTEDEREIIAGIADDDEYTEEGQDIAKALLARSSPPEVVLESWREAAGEVVSLEDVRAALAAFGVAVKEVGSE